MQTTTEARELYDFDGQHVSTYCETCYEAPRGIAVEMRTTSAQGIDPAATIAAFVVTCLWCGKSARYEVTGATA